MTFAAECPRTKTQDLTLWAAAFVLSLAQWRHAAYFFGNCNGPCDMSDVVRAVQAEVGVLQGYPHWRFFQSRLLGPWLEKSLNFLFGINFLVAHMIIAIAGLTFAGGVMFYAGRAIGGRQSGWSALLAFQTLFALMMSRPWLYIWDYFILLVGRGVSAAGDPSRAMVVAPVADGRGVSQPRIRAVHWRVDGGSGAG